MSTKFFTNSEENTLLKKFEGAFEYGQNIQTFKALIGYFRASGYFKVRPFLEKIPVIKIIVGINVDKLTKKYHEKGQLYLAQPETVKNSFIEDMRKNIQDANYDKQTEDGILQFLDDIAAGKLEMRSHPDKKIHAKVYIFLPENFNEFSPCEVITGSSNFTNAGLGADPDSNYEFNVALRDYDEVKFADDEFEKLWAESIPILEEEANRIKDGTYLKDDYTPFELYIKMLIEYFGSRVEYDPYNIDLLLPDKYLKLKYQSDAANQGYAIMMKHNGFILSDVVGLGKTIIACMIIKKFIYENGTHTRILVVVPPAIKSSWVKTVRDFQLDIHFHYETTGSLHNILDTDNFDSPNADQFDLIVVDESHKFRNDYTDMYVKLQDICKRERARQGISGERTKKVILISATPLNNRPQDIENQLYLFQDKRRSTLENIKSLQEYFKPINEEYKKLAYERELNIGKLKNLFQKLRDDVIESLVIRRTRTDIENNPDYMADLKKQGISFPKVDDPAAVYYNLEGSLSKLFYETVSLITGIDENGNESDGLGYFRYRAIEFLTKKEDRKIFGDVKSISTRLSSLMRTLLVKRLESSFFAFTQSIGRLQRAYNNMIEMFNNNKVFIAPDLDINKLLEDGFSYEQIEEKVNLKGGNNTVFESRSFNKDFISLLKEDKVKIDNLITHWNKIKKDPKLIEFLKQIDEEFFNPKKNVSGKLIIFSESQETTAELAKSLKKQKRYKVLTVNSSNRDELEIVIKENFDANYDQQWKNDFNILITTEVLAEGINLHRANVIVNYDVPWNATRLMQRIGRINRIGSTAKNIYVYNFYPSAHGDEQIHLVKNALRKLQSFHSAFGEDNKIFSLLEEKGDGALFGNKIPKEESEILKYLQELRDFRKNSPKKFNEIKGIKNKARCCREVPDGAALALLSEDACEIKQSIKGTTLSYLKSANHPGVFCLVTPELNIVELSFLQAVKLFKAGKNEKPFNKLPESHFAQTLAGLEFFKSEKNQDAIKTTSRKNLNATENKAISNLNSLVKIAPTKQKKEVLQNAIETIKKGTFTGKGLPKQVNDFFIANNALAKDHLVFIDNLFVKILDKYSFSSSKNGNKNFETEEQGIISPKIIITESFC
jgi:superfamily II DNA/RNA helicase